MPLTSLGGCRLAELTILIVASASRMSKVRRGGRQDVTASCRAEPPLLQTHQVRSSIMPTNVLVVGMARSGTSMTARIFADAGYYVAHEEGKLQDADLFNPSGYWEAPKVLNANRRLLARVGFGFDNTWMFDAITEEQAEQIPELEHAQEDVALVEEYERNAPWVWKDARLCYTLGYWWPLMDENTTRVLLLTRDRREILRSFRRVKWRQDMDPAGLYECIAAHLQSARRTIERLDIPFVEVDYSDFAKDPEGLARRLSSAFGVKLSKEDLGYVPIRNSSSISGRFRTILERIWRWLPGPVRRTVKAAVGVPEKIRPSSDR